MACQVAQTCLTLLHVLQGLRKLVSPDFEINMHYLKEVNRSVLDSTYHTSRLWYTDRGSTLIHAKEYFLPDSSISQSPRIARPTDLQCKNDVCYSPYVLTRRRGSNILTYSIVQSPSWEANWFAASQEIPRISWNPKVHYRTHKRPPPVSILGQSNPV